MFGLPFVVQLSVVSNFEISAGPEVIKRFSCSTQLSMKFQLLIKLKC